MRVITFQDRFAELVRLGLKCQTIRQSARCKPGDTLSLRRWVGKPRQRGSRQETLRTVKCASVRSVTIYPMDDSGKAVIEVDGILLNGLQRDAIAHRDGFDNPNDMTAWFHMTHGVPFYGYVIRWNVPPATGAADGKENRQ